MIERLILKIENKLRVIEDQILDGGLRDYAEYKAACARVDTLRAMIEWVRNAVGEDDEES